MQTLCPFFPRALRSSPPVVELDVRQRTHLRTRVFLLTALGACLLVGVTAALTFISRQSERKFRDLVDSEIATERTLVDTSRRLGTWQRRWMALETDSRQRDLAELAADLNSIVGSVGDSPELAEWRASLMAFDSRVALEAERWPKYGLDERSTTIHRVLVDVNSLATTARDRARVHTRNIEVELERLSRQTRDLMWVSLAIVWIIVIISFAVARRTLDAVVIPVERLAEAARSLKKGDGAARAPIAGDAEIATLGAAFNEMAEALTESHRALEERARTDELTGLPNYRAFREALDAEIQRALRFEYEFGLLMIDVDRFKRYNDTWGHQAGNEALSMVARRVVESIRAIDTAARFGGEEIAVILPRVDPQTLGATAERIRRSIETNPALGSRDPITVSVGGALFPSEADTPQTLFEIADAMLYRAKENGRNRTELATTDNVVPHPRRRKAQRRRRDRG